MTQKKGDSKLKLQKQAMDLLQTYKTREDDGSIVRKPIINAEDVAKATSILNRVLKLEKYQKIINDLKAKAETSANGVVNFVTGRESGEIVEAIIKSAFPPGSGSVYRAGNGGYAIDCANWQGDGAPGLLHQVMKGQPKSFSREDLEEMRALAKEEHSFNEKTPAGEVKTSVTALSPYLTQWLGAEEGSGGDSNISFTDGSGPENEEPTVEDVLDEIEGLEKQLSNVHAQLNAIGRDPSKAKRRKLLNMGDLQLKVRIAGLKQTLPKWVNWTGASEYDGSGFMDYEVTPGNLRESLNTLFNPKDLFDRLAKEHASNGEPPPTEADRMAHYQNIIDIARAELLQFTKHDDPGINSKALELDTILSHNPKDVLSSSDLIRKTFKALYRPVKDQQRILILNNVSDSGLVNRASPNHPPTFAAPQLLMGDYSYKSKRGERAIVLVSRERINFPFDGAQYVELTDMGVDDDEAEELIEYFKSVWRDKIEKAGGDAANLRLRSGDIKKLKNLLTGKTQKQALQLLKEGFLEAFDSDDLHLDGQKLWKHVMTLNNNLAKGNAEVGGRAIFYLEPKQRMETYITDAESDWGIACDKYIQKVERAKELWEQETKLREQLSKAEDSGATAKDKRTLEKEIEKIANIAQRYIESIPHFLILYGPAGSGKSDFAAAFADLTKFSLYDIDLGQARGGLVGQTEEYTGQLFNALKSMADAVIRLDEIDGQVVGQEEEARASHGANAMKQFLSFTQDNKELFKRRNLFIVATTNNPDLIRSQLMNRAEVIEVPPPTNKQGYYAFLKTVPEVLPRYAETGFVWGEGIYTKDDMWKATEELWNTLDLEKVADALVGSGLNFRKLIDWIGDAFDAHMRYIESTARKQLFDTDRASFREKYPSYTKTDPSTGKVVDMVPDIEGFPLTTEMLVEAASMTSPKTMRGRRVATAYSESLVDDGIPKLELKLAKQRRGETEEADGEQQGVMDFGLIQPAPGAPQQAQPAQPAQQPAPQEQAPPQPGEEGDDDLKTSDDHYLRHLQKSGVLAKLKAEQQKGVKTIQEKNKKHSDKEIEGYPLGSYRYDNVHILPVDLKMRFPEQKKG